VVDNTVTDYISYKFYVAENRCHECTRLLVKILYQDIFGLVRTGCESSIMNERLYNRLRYEGLKCFQLPTQHVSLLSTFNTKINSSKRQAMLPVNIADVTLSQIV
jgi:hypothetical protein